MNCLYSQFVNEWAMPLRKGPEAISRLSAWINGEPGGGGIPFSMKGLYVHCPIEVRVSDTSNTVCRPFLDNTARDGPTLYLNATLYRAYSKDPPCWRRYYEAFEWLMQEMDAKPHYAKNFSYTTSSYLQEQLGDGLTNWVRVRNEADPDGMFLGEWHKRTLGLDDIRYSLQEHEIARKEAANGGQLWVGQIRSSPSPELFVATPLSLPTRSQSPGASSSASSFDMIGADADKSMYMGASEYVWRDEAEENDDEGDLTDRDDARYHANPKKTLTGTAVFDKM